MRNKQAKGAPCVMIDLVIETEAEPYGPLRVLCLRSFETRGQNVASISCEVVRIEQVEDLSEQCSGVSSLELECLAREGRLTQTGPAASPGGSALRSRTALLRRQYPGAPLLLI